MRSLNSSRVPRVSAAALLAVALVLASAGAVAAKRPPKPPPPPPSRSPSITIEIAPAGTLEPSGEYANVDVTATCPVGWTLIPATSTCSITTAAAAGPSARLHGHGAGRPIESSQREPIHARQLERQRLRDHRSQRPAGQGRQHEDHPARAGRHRAGGRPGSADRHGGGGVRIAIAVACPIGATGQQSSVTVSQGTARHRRSSRRSAIASAIRRPLDDGLPGDLPHRSAVGNASVTVTWNGEAFSGADNRAITLLESSTGDTTPPTTPAGLWANTFGDAETGCHGAHRRQRHPDGPDRLRGLPERPIRPGDLLRPTEAILYGDSAS